MNAPAWLRRVLGHPVLPPLTLVALGLFLFARVLLRLDSAWVGDTCKIDTQAMIQQLWLLRHHHYDVAELSRTVMPTFPTPTNLLAELGFLVDLGIFALLQALFGAVAGFNLAALAILVGLGLAIYHCARRFDLPPWAAAVAGGLMMTAHPVLREVVNGRYYLLLSVATTALCLAQWPQLLAGSRRAALLMGTWLALTTVIHGFSGVLVAIFLVPVTLIPLFQRRGRERTRLFGQVLLFAGATALAAAGPVLWQLANMPAGESGLGGFTSHAAYYMEVLGKPELEGRSLLRQLREQMVRTVPALLVLAMLPVRWGRRLKVVFIPILVGAVFVAWGPYQALAFHLPGTGPVRLVVPMPYLLLRECVPYLWRFLWLARDTVFANVAVALLFAGALAALWDYRVRAPALLRSLLALATLAAILSPVRTGQAPFRASSTLEAGPAETADALRLLERVSDNPEVEAVYPYPRSLQLHSYYARPIACSKWAQSFGCNGFNVEFLAAHFASFLDLARGTTAARVEEALCLLRRKGVSHLLYFGPPLLTDLNPPPGGSRLVVRTDLVPPVRALFDRLMERADEGGSVVLYRLPECPP